MKKRTNWFLIFTIAYFIAYALPSFWQGRGEFMFGVQCALFATYLMFGSLVTFVGNLSNIMVLIILILKTVKSTSLIRSSNLVKAILIGITFISVATWVLFMGIEPLHVGYYVWAVSCVGIVSSYLFSPPIKLEFESDIMDHLIDE